MGDSEAHLVPEDFHHGMKDVGGGSLDSLEDDDHRYHPAAVAVAAVTVAASTDGSLDAVNQHTAVEGTGEQLHRPGSAASSGGDGVPPVVAGAVAAEIVARPESVDLSADRSVDGEGAGAVAAAAVVTAAVVEEHQAPVILPQQPVVDVQSPPVDFQQVDIFLRNDIFLPMVSLAPFLNRPI